MVQKTNKKIKREREDSDCKGFCSAAFVQNVTDVKTEFKLQLLLIMRTYSDFLHAKTN